MKYVILQEIVHEGVYRLHHLIFPEFITHAYVAEGYAREFRRNEKKLLTVVSAGFCYMDNAGDWECTTGSESLRISKNNQNDSKDALIINKPEAFNGLHY